LLNVDKQALFLDRPIKWRFREKAVSGNVSVAVAQDLSSEVVIVCNQ
jgi:hypothetical protein